MFGKSKNNDNELEDRDINLLPEEIRKQAEREHRFMRTPSSPELRAPKKEKAVRPRFGWIPFFGRSHWGVQSAAHPETKKPSIAEKVERIPGSAEEKTRERREQVVKPAPTSVHVFPKVTIQPKVGVVGFGYGRTTREAPVARTTSETTQQEEARPRTFVPEPRHYSLLEEEPAKEAPRPIVPQPEVAKGAVPMTDTIREARPAMGPVTPKPPAPRRGGFFAWLAGLFAPHPKKPAIKPPAAKPIGPIPEREALRTSSSPITFEKKLRVHAGLPPTITPIPVLKPKKPGFFAWLAGLFRRKPRPPKPPKSLKPPIFVPKPVPPMSPITPAAATSSRTLQAPEPSVPSTPAPAPIVPIARPPQAPVAPQTPQIISKAVPTVLQPAPKPPLPPAPVAPQLKTPEPAGKPPKKGGGHRFGGFSFHMPKRGDFSAAASDARVVNLIPGVLAVQSWAKVSQLVGGAALAAAGVVAIAYGALSIWKVQLETRTAEIDQQIEQYRNDIRFYEATEPEMSEVGNRINVIRMLLGQHIYWTQFFSLLEKYTLPDVYYDGVSATTAGTLSLSAHASSYESVTKFVKLLNSQRAKEFVSKAAIYGAQQVESGEEGVVQVDFSIELTLNPKLFYYNNAVQTQ